MVDSSKASGCSERKSVRPVRRDSKPERHVPIEGVKLARGESEVVKVAWRLFQGPLSICF